MFSMESHQDSREHSGTWPTPGLPKTLPWDVETRPQLPGLQLMAQSTLHHLQPSSALHRCPLPHPTPWNPRLGQVRRDHRAHLLQPPCSSRAIPEHRAQGCVQTLLEYLQWGRLHSLSAQSVPVFGHCTGQKFFLMFRWNSLGISFCPLLLGITKQSLVHPLAPLL